MNQSQPSKRDWREDFDREYAGVICDGAGIADQSTREDIKDFIEYLLNEQLLAYQNKITFSSVSPTWIGDEPAWTFIAIQGGSVIWSSKEPVKRSTVRFLYHQKTGKSSSQVTTVEETRIAAEEMYTNYLQEEKI